MYYVVTAPGISQTVYQSSQTNADLTVDSTVYFNFLYEGSYL